MVNSLLQMRLASLLWADRHASPCLDVQEQEYEQRCLPETQRREVRRKVDGYSCCLVRGRKEDRNRKQHFDGESQKKPEDFHFILILLI